MKRPDTDLAPESVKEYINYLEDQNNKLHSILKEFKKMHTYLTLVSVPEVGRDC